VLITKHFVFIHLPKAGGSFLRRLCDQYLPEDWIVEHEVGKHAGDRKIPEECQDLPRFGLIRNPWEWYVSLHHYNLGVGRPPEHRERIDDRNWLTASNDGTHDFKTTMVNILNGKIYNQNLAERMRERDVDMLTLFHDDRFGQSLHEGRITLGKAENLRADFLAFLDAHEVPVPDTFRTAVLQRRPVNVSPHEPYQTYYDEELRDLLDRKARYLIDRYGYCFE
jgi:hypothetical protein